MVAGSPVQGLTSWKVSVTPWNGVVVDVAWAKAGPAMSPSNRGTSSKNNFRAMWHSLPTRASEGWRDWVELGSHLRPTAPSSLPGRRDRPLHSRHQQEETGHGNPCGSISKSPH